MENDLYKLMIFNIRRTLNEQNPIKPSEDDFTVWEISEVLAMALNKRKEDIIFDIIDDEK